MRGMYPADGLCDLLFYTHVYTTGLPLSQVNAIESEISFKTFKRVSPTYKYTGTGVSFSLR